MEDDCVEEEPEGDPVPRLPEAVGPAVEVRFQIPWLLNEDTRYEDAPPESRLE